MVGQESCAFTHVHRLNICHLCADSYCGHRLRSSRGKDGGGGSYQARTDFTHTASTDDIYLVSLDPNLTLYLHILHRTLYNIITLKENLTFVL